MPPRPAPVTSVRGKMHLSTRMKCHEIFSDDEQLIMVRETRYWGL
jgi:hypothetical protein